MSNEFNCYDWIFEVDSRGAKPWGNKPMSSLGN